MHDVQQRVCGAANRVDVVVGFVLSSSDRAERVARIRDAFRITQELLLDINLSGHLDDVAELLSSGQIPIRKDERDWSEFTTGQIQSWQSAKLSQKSIERVGDMFVSCSPQPCYAETFLDAIRQLEYAVTFTPEEHAGKWAGFGLSQLTRQMDAFSLAVVGLSVTATNISAASERKAFTGLSFGAWLLTKAVFDMHITFE